jgi:hypothetical protein
VEIGARQAEDIGHCFEAGVNFVVESIETLPTARNSCCVTAASSSIELSFFLGIWMVVTLPASQVPWMVDVGDVSLDHSVLRPPRRSSNMVIERVRVSIQQTLDRLLSMRPDILMALDNG